MALGTQPVGKLLDFEQYIEHQIKRTRARIKMTDVLGTTVTSVVTLARSSGVSDSRFSACCLKFDPPATSANVATIWPRLRVS